MIPNEGMISSARKMPQVQTLLERGGKTEAYEAFEVVELCETHAVLTGPLLLEVGETLRLRFLVQPKPVEVDATVAKVDLEHAQMTVNLFGVPEEAFTPTNYD